MRIFTASVIIAALSLGTPAFVQAQAQGTPPQSEAQTPPAQSNKLIKSVQIVSVKDLKPEMRSKIDDVVARTSEEDMQSLRKSIDSTPEAASALKAEGLSSSGRFKAASLRRPMTIVAGSNAAVAERASNDVHMAAPILLPHG